MLFHSNKQQQKFIQKFTAITRGDLTVKCEREMEMEMAFNQKNSGLVFYDVTVIDFILLSFQVRNGMSNGEESCGYYQKK